jgi:L-rhamnose isomerase
MQVRAEMDRPVDPLRQYRQDTYAQQVAAKRGIAISAGSAIQ